MPPDTSRMVMGQPLTDIERIEIWLMKACRCRVSRRSRFIEWLHRMAPDASEPLPLKPALP
jgi:hypothetical protein